MISIKDAKIRLLEESERHKKSLIRLNINKVFGLVLAEDIKAKCYSPPFNQSAMDGYALRIEDAAGTNPILLKTDIEISAGGNKSVTLKPNTAVRIFTGAKTPSNCTLVIPQEDIVVDENNVLHFDRSKFSKCDNIRLKGSQFNKAEVVLNKGIIMNGARIAIAATAGHAAVKVVASPKVSIIVCGNELVKPGSSLGSDKIYESNSLMLSALLKEYNIELASVSYAKDNISNLENTIKKAFKKSDVVLVSGGISVGKYDFVQTALHNLKTQKVFYKIKQKPGKPLYFGRNKNNFVFGLPGNPAASLTCFYEYVLPFIKSLSGLNFHPVLPKKTQMLNEYKKKPGLTHFLKAFVNDQGLTILPDQESYKLTSFANANCLAIIPEECTEVKKGDLMEYHII